MNASKARGLVPPRPNLGPEPWRDPAPANRLLLALAVVAIGLVLVAWAWRRRRSIRARSIGLASRALSDADPGPRGRLVGLSETIRDALTAQFGSSFRAKTTEELSADERLILLLGEDGFRELMQFLDRIDRVKFAPVRPADQDEELSQALTIWEPLMTVLASRIRAGPRADPGGRPTARGARSEPAWLGRDRLCPGPGPDGSIFRHAAIARWAGGPRPW